jgi:riboflavin synthase
MFSGIIEKVALVRRADFAKGALTLALETGFSDLALGESIAVNGVCLTVTEFDADGLAVFFVSDETLARSNLKSLRANHKVNLERAVSLATRLSGHMVQGHVDGTAIMQSVAAEAGAWKLELALPPALSRYCVEKGSIALNGISLTLNAVRDHADHTVIAITIIPHTWQHTNLHEVQAGDAVNVEVDVMAKYVERLCQPYLKT